MRLVFSMLVALVLAVPAAAQTLEERMRTAAGAYERKDFATAISIWRPIAARGNAEAVRDAVVIGIRQGQRQQHADGPPSGVFHRFRRYGCCPFC